MRTKEEFNLYYKSELEPQLKKLEKKRMQNVYQTFFRRLLRVVFFSGSIIISLQFPWKEEANILVGIIVGLALGYISGITLYNGVLERRKLIRSLYKQNIITRIVQFINPALQYESNKHIAMADFNESNLFLMRADNYSGDDLVSGKLGKTDIRFSEVNVSQQVQKGYNTEENNSIFRDIMLRSFQGIFFVADFHKHIYGETYVVPAKYSSPKTGYQTVKTESIEFEKLFKTFSTDQVEARYILSLNLMNSITSLRKRARNNDLYFSFINSKMFIAIRTSADFFEPTQAGTMVNYTFHEVYFDLLNLLIGVVEELNLNTRIWTKE